MEYGKEKEPLKCLCSKGTKEILELLAREGIGRYKDFTQFASTHTINGRLKYLLHHGFIQHHFTKDDKRKEWYTITEKGRKTLKVLNDLERLVQD
jgi:DNA-binding HxlR family transcriptional regulator